jgi:proteasome lid subunit RPN8/RPN11
LPPNGGEPIGCEIPRSYLRSLAEQKAQDLVAQGQLEQGASFQYVVSAFACGPMAEATNQAPEAPFELESLVEEIAMEECAMGSLVDRSTTHGPVIDEDAPVFVPKRVVAEAIALSATARDKEIGGVFLGKLRRARGAAEAFIEITAQIPAQHTESTSVKLTFTENTWAAVRDVVELRAEQELLMGWWHTHPNFCAKCPAENRARCSYATDFFSKDDVFLHRTCFPRGYQIALLLSDHGGTIPSVSMFGWRRGEVAARGFFIVESPPASANEEPNGTLVAPNA